MTMRFLMSVNALALATIFSFSLADIFSDGDLLSAESLSTDSNFFFNDDWQDSEDLTLAFNDVVYPADPDTNFIAASTCGGGDGNLNKLRLRRDGGTSCLTGDAPNEQKDGVIVPEVFQPGEPVLDRLEATTKAGSGKCVLAPYLTNVCCQGFLGVIYSMGPPRVWSTVDNCYTNFANAPCPTQYDACCQFYDQVARDGILCYVIGYTVSGSYYPLDPTAPGPGNQSPGQPPQPPQWPQLPPNP